MNKKDCENIGLILAETQAPEEIRKKFFGLDSRIEGEYECYAFIEKRHDAVRERTDELMNERHGTNWALKKATKDGKDYRECREQATREIYGDEFHPSLLR